MNVKVVSLPQGEDPDSYVQQVGADAFKDYIEKAAKDFIFFKTDLLLADAGNDPVKKSSVIRSIVDSIARIPDPLKKALYVKECARLVAVEEQILMNEINKLVAIDFKKQRQAKATANQDHYFPPPSDNLKSVHTPSPPKPKEVKSTGDAFQEKDIVRILINDGGKVFDPKTKTTVAQYILKNIEDVVEDFKNPAYEKIVKESMTIAKKTITDWTAYFTGHQDQSISKLAIDLIHSPFDYSENWEKRWNIFLQTQKMPDENFLNDSKQALMRFRLKKVIQKCKENQGLIDQHNKEGNMEKMILHLKVQQKLLAMRNDLAKELGTVVF